jgi:hypothetical protein
LSPRSGIANDQQVPSRAVIGFSGFLILTLWNTREVLAEARREIESLEQTREADNRAFKRIMSERDEIQRRYDVVTRELSEITDEPSVNYLDTPVPDSVRRLLER